MYFSPYDWLLKCFMKKICEHKYYEMSNVFSSVRIYKVSLLTCKFVCTNLKTVGENVTDLSCINCKSNSRQLTLCVYDLEKSFKSICQR